MADELFDRGAALRRAVLGDAYVDQALSGAAEEVDPLQSLVTRWCWGEIWGRPGLEMSTRSLLNVALLIALNRPHELRLHLKGALRNGCTPAELKEVVLHCAVYCGVPAAVDADRILRAVLAEDDE